MKYRPEIDGLRAMAVLPVILFHAGFQSFSGGFVGVDVFFVISGYLITSIILYEKQAGTFTVINFYERRARRILPALFVVMFTCLPFAWLWLLPVDMKSFSYSLIAVSGFSSNILFYLTSGYFETAADLKPLLHTWSLAVEEQYYVLFPMFLMLSWKLGKSWIISLLAIVAIISLALAQWSSLTHTSFAFFLLPTRAWEILVGAFVAFYLVNKSLNATYKTRSILINQLISIIGFLLITYSIFAFDETTPFPSLFTLVPTIGAALIILSATSQTFVGKLLGSKLFVGVGLISYSAYLWHQPLFAFARHSSLDEPSHFFLAMLAVAALVLAFFSWKYVETPFRNKQRFTRKKIFVFGIIGSIFFVVIGLIGYLTDYYYFRSYAEVINLAANASNQKNRNDACWNAITKTKDLSKACQLGISGSISSFAIVGDSHAGTLVEELNVAATDLNLSGFDFSYKSCPPLYKGFLKPEDSSRVVCNKLRDDFFQKLTNHSLPNTLILSARWSLWIEQDPFDNKEGGIESERRINWYAPNSENIGYKEAVKKSYLDSVKLMLDAGYKVILVYPIPEVGWDVPKRLTKLYTLNHFITEKDVSTSTNVFNDRNRLAYAALDSIGIHKNLIRIKPDKLFCDTYLKNRCITHLSGVPLYIDHNHLSNAGAKLVVKEIIKYIN